MSRGHPALVLVGAVLSLCAGCGGGGHGGRGVTSPSGGGGNALLSADPGSRFGGSHPAPVVVGGVTYVYQNTGADGTQVEASSDGVSFAPTPAAFPAGISRTIVGVSGGRFRMYYFADSTAVDISSAISSDGLNWTVESGTRFGDPDIGAIRAMALPTGGYRIYYVTSAGISSARSGDGLTFVVEGPMAIPPPESTSTWGASAAIYLNGRYHMALTRVPSSGATDIWHAVSSDGRNWTVDKVALVASPGVPFNQPAWSINGSVTRIYYRIQPSGGGNVIGSGVFTY